MAVRLPAAARFAEPVAVPVVATAVSIDSTPTNAGVPVMATGSSWLYGRFVAARPLRVSGFCEITMLGVGLVNE